MRPEQQPRSIFNRNKHIKAKAPSSVYTFSARAMHHFLTSHRDWCTGEGSHVVHHSLFDTMRIVVFAATGAEYAPGGAKAVDVCVCCGVCAIVTPLHRTSRV